MARTIEEVLEATYASDPVLRTQAVRELCPCKLQSDSAVVWDRLFEMTRDPNLKVRRNALHSMIDGSPRARVADVVAALEGMRDDVDAKMRRNVRKLLAQHRRTGRINIEPH